MVASMGQHDAVDGYVQCVELRATAAWLSERGEESDGLVLVASQKWGEVMREIDADHWAQIGWSNGFDALALYEDLLVELRGRGF